MGPTSVHKSLSPTLERKALSWSLLPAPLLAEVEDGDEEVVPPPAEVDDEEAASLRLSWTRMRRLSLPPDLEG